MTLFDLRREIQEQIIHFENMKIGMRPEGIEWMDICKNQNFTFRDLIDKEIKSIESRVSQLESMLGDNDWATECRTEEWEKKKELDTLRGVLGK